MSKNWTMAEVAHAINNKEMESYLDFGKRFPVATNVMTAAIAGDKEAVMALFGAFPEYMTMGKIDKALKTQIEEGTFGTPAATAASGEDDVEDDVAESGKEAKKPAEEKAAPSKASSGDDNDLNSKTSSELYYIGKEVGLKGADLKGSKADLIARIEAAQSGEGAKPAKKPAKKDAGSSNEGKSAKELYTECKAKGLDVEQKKPAQYYIEALAAAEEADEDDGEVDYSKMSAKELYGICKEKGLSPEQKKPVKYYLDLIEADGAEEEGDDWAGDDEAEEAPEKKPAKAKAKAEDDEWEI